MGDFNMEEEVELLKQAGFGDEEIAAHLESSDEIETIEESDIVDVSSAIPAPEPVQAPETENTEVLISQLEEAGFSPDQIAEHVRESGLAQPSFESQEQEDFLTDGVNTPDVAGQPKNVSGIETQAEQNLSPQNAPGETSQVENGDFVEPGLARPVTEDVIEGINEAQSAGVPREEIRDHLLSEGYSNEVLDLLGYDPVNVSEEFQTIDQKIEESATPFNIFASHFGMSDEDIASVPSLAKETANLILSIPTGIAKGIDKVQKNKYDHNELLLANKNAHGNLKQVLDSVGLFGEEAQKVAKVYERKVQQIGVNSLINAGFVAFVDPKDGKTKIRNEDNTITEPDIKWYEEILAAKGEIGAGVIGEEVLRRSAKKAGKGPIGVAGAAVTGIMVGTAAGRYADLAYDSHVMQEKLSQEFRLRQSLQAGTEAVVMTAIAGAGIKAGTKASGAIADYVKNTIKGFSDARLEASARQSLIEQNYLLPEELDAIVESAEKAGVQLPGNTDTQKYIAAIAVRDQKGFVRGVVEPAGKLAEPEELAKLGKSVDQRAKLALEELKGINKKTSPMDIKKSYDNYTKQLKDTYGLVKDAASQLAPDFRFDLKTEVIDVLENSIRPGLSDPAKARQFANMMQTLESSKATRNMEGAIDLINLTNKVKFSGGINTVTKKLLDEVSTSLNNTIHKGLTDHAGAQTANKWRKDFSTINKHYSKMLRNKSNSIVKILSKRQATPKEIRTVLAKHMDSPEIIEEAMTGLPRRLSKNVDLTYMKMMTEKFEIGKTADVVEDSLQAVDWSKLAKAISGTSPKSAEGKQYKHIVKQFSEIARADKDLSKISRGLKADSISSIHTQAGPAIKSIFLRRSFNAAQRYLNTPGGRANALVHVTSKLLNAPLDEKTVKTAVNLMPNKAAKDEFKEAILELQTGYAKANKEANTQTTVVRPENSFHDTKYGKGTTTRRTAVSDRNGIEVSTETMIDASKMSEAEIRDIVSSPAIMQGRGFTSIYDGKKIYSLDEPLEVDIKPPSVKDLPGFKEGKSKKQVDKEAAEKSKAIEQRDNILGANDEDL